MELMMLIITLSLIVDPYLHVWNALILETLYIINFSTLFLNKEDKPVWAITEIIIVFLYSKTLLNQNTQEGGFPSHQKLLYNWGGVHIPPCTILCTLLSPVSYI